MFAAAKVLPATLIPGVVAPLSESSKVPVGLPVKVKLLDLVRPAHRLAAGRKTLAVDAVAAAVLAVGLPDDVKSPLTSMATSGQQHVPPVYVFTWNGASSGLPLASYRRA